MSTPLTSVDRDRSGPVSEEMDAPSGARPDALVNETPSTTGWPELEASVKKLEDTIRIRNDDGTDWVKTLNAVTKGVEVALQEHQELSEQEGGNLDDLMMRQPSLIPRVDKQKEDHVTLRQRAASLSTVLERAYEFDTADPDRLCLEARILHDSIRLHMILESELLQEAYRQVEGGEQG